jgi:hypothetical protein
VVKEPFCGVEEWEALVLRMIYRRSAGPVDRTVARRKLSLVSRAT